MKNNFKHIFFSILFLFSVIDGFTQSNFEFTNKTKKQTVSFKLLSNLIVFPIEVNGKKLNFILDSGVGLTILFNLNVHDSIQLNNVEKIKLQGLGNEAPVAPIVTARVLALGGAVIFPPLADLVEPKPPGSVAPVAAP